MEKLVIYGAGNWCRLLLKGTQLNDYEIIKVVDGDSKKWNTRIEEFLIEKPEVIMHTSYDKVLIAAKAYQGIAETLLGEFQVAQDKILYADFDNNQLHALKDCGIRFRQGMDGIIEKGLFRMMACETILESLLFECMQNGEFYQNNGKAYREVIVIGEDEQLSTVRRFFSCMPGNLTVKKGLLDAPVIDTAKYILTAASYQEDLKQLRDLGASARQCVIIPLFDVDATVII